MEEDDFVEQRTHLPRAAQCRECRNVKPLEQFRHRLTCAESMARGADPGIRYTIRTHLCRECRPRRKSAAELTRKEIHNRVTTGQFTTIKANALLTTKEIKATRAMVAGVTKRWDDHYAKHWQHITDAIQKEMKTIQQQMKYAKAMGKHAVLAALTHYVNALRAKKSSILLASYRNNGNDTNHQRQLPASPHWQEQFTKEEIDAIDKMFSSTLSGEVRRVPALIAYRKKDE
jgi:hypothetical protein